MSSSPLDELKNLNQARTSLMACQSVDEVIQKALELVRDKLNSQVASIFLFTKNGVIKRKGINGIDKEGNPIDNSWFPEEEYAPGASFSGKAIPTFEAESGFGEPQWSNDLPKFTMDQKTKIPYLKKLGNLKCGISVPINGRYRTFGTIEVINKLDDNKFSCNDVYWLTHIATIVANFISDSRKKKEVNLFTEITQKLIFIERNDHDHVLSLQEIYDLVVEKITEDYTPYKACILRIINTDKSSEIKSKSSGISKVYWSNIQMNVRKPYSGIAGEVLKTKKPIFIMDIDLELDKFFNRKFIDDNSFKSYACIPLLVKGEVLGTISVFIGYNHKFSTNHEKFLSNLGYLTAAIIAKVRLIDELNNIEAILKDESWTDEPIPQKPKKLINDHNIAAYEKLKLNEKWLAKYKDKYVAFMDGEQLPDSDEDEQKLLEKLKTSKYQDKPIFFTKVEENPRIIDLPSSLWFDDF